MMGIKTVHETPLTFNQTTRPIARKFITSLVQPHPKFLTDKELPTKESQKFVAEARLHNKRHSYALKSV
jgi:hypothetical protein